MQNFTKSIGLLLSICLLSSIKVMAQQSGGKSVNMADSVARYRQDSIARANAPKATGNIKDGATGKPVSGVSVSVDGYSAALTDDHGHFSVSVPSYDAVLMVSFQGYQKKYVPLKGQHTIPDVILFEDTYSSIYDEAKLPFSNVPASKLSNAVSSVNTFGAWEPSKLETADSYLQGKVAGLNVVRRSGTPNVGANLFLRGFSSLYGTNAPLIVLDGMIFDTQRYGNSIIAGHVTNPFETLDLHDVDNITVLKDAQAGIYGTKGANGVILITTNSNPDLATKIDLGLYSSYNYMPQSDLLPLMQSKDYRVYLSDLLHTTPLSQDQIASLPFMNDNAASNPDYYVYHNNTNWQKQSFANGYNKNVDLRVSGGDNIARYVLSMQYGNNKGITPYTDLTKYSTRFNGNLNISKNFTINTTLAFAYNSQNLKDQGVAPRTSPSFLSLIKSPLLRTQQVNSSGIESPNQADVDIFNYSNPAVLLSKTQESNQYYRFFGNFDFKYQISKFFAAQSLIGVTADKVRENTFIPRTGVTGDTLANGQIIFNRLGSQVQRLFNLYSDTYLSYNRTFNRIHQLNAYLGMRYTQSNNYSNIDLGYNSAIDQLVSVTYSVPALRIAGGDLGAYRWFSNYFNVNYELSNKYIFGFNVTADASSRFGTNVPGALHVGGTSYAVLPSGSAAWIMSSERFMSGLKFIELLKLRASYGLTGNDDIGNYAARQYYVSQNLLGQQGLVRGSFGNPGLQWELNRKLDLGLDASFLQDRLNVTADYYRNVTDKMITQTPAPVVSGVSYAITNDGGMQTNGVELSVNGRIISKPNFKWDLGFNIATYRNKITKLPANNLINQYAGANIITSIGSPVAEFYGYKTNGVYASNAEAASAGISVRNAAGTLIPQQGGDMRFVDVNGDKVIDSKDMQVIGNPNPDFVGGITTGFTYKRISLNALISFVKGNQVYNYTRRMLESESNFYNQTLAINNRWRGDGQVTSIPRASYGDPSGNSAFSDRWIEDGSYIRLRSVTASYDVPFKAKYFKYVKVYVTGYNLLTFTKYLGYDPEFAANENVLLQGIDTGLEPQIKNIQLGIRVGI
ncbi:TonB-linked SusC/RagA family outer membrane protein [Mucilaginibacter yixingensis]|uniref:TonB-linked SusC/RagA family outer membrane protein n=1 Tax=Mucilaginibacter yixingensis TaxID=1295612 RepID=A0A2T5JB86_9SPHI|nr:SusC/RagA family TonB-linked outer membrane protein [Mucilaginibacter yixingensis]PTQ98132.1 TonB-linked SusC/RagA family outer membrane protein [Mucilaginibacter yixingensis]